jgi:hypothetical protein
MMEGGRGRGRGYRSAELDAALDEFKASFGSEHERETASNSPQAHSQLSEVGTYS